MLLLGIFFIGLSSDLFLFAIPSDFRYAALILFWIIIARVKHLKSEYTFKLALGILGLLFVFFILQRESLTTDRIATWFYLIIFVGIIQQFFELSREQRASK